MTVCSFNPLLLLTVLDFSIYPLTDAGMMG